MPDSELEAAVTMAKRYQMQQARQPQAQPEAHQAANHRQPRESMQHAQALTERITITNPQGLHMRPATLLAVTAQKFASDIWLIASGQRINGKSLWDLISLGAVHGTELIVEVVGTDAPLALAAVLHVLSTQSLDEDESLIAPG